MSLLNEVQAAQVVHGTMIMEFAASVSKVDKLTITFNYRLQL